MGLGSRAIACRSIRANIVFWLVDTSTPVKSKKIRVGLYVVLSIYDDDDD